MQKNIAKLITRTRSLNGRIHMTSRLIIAAAIALFFAPAAAVHAQEHPEHPEHPTKGKAAAKRVSTADISTGIKSTKVRICLSI